MYYNNYYSLNALYAAAVNQKGKTTKTIFFFIVCKAIFFIDVRKFFLYSYKIIFFHKLKPIFLKYF